MKWISFISTADYLISALVLNQSLKNVNSQYPFLLAITKNLDIEPYISILKQEQIEYITIPNLNYKIDNSLKNFVANKPSLLNTASKIALFNLQLNEKLIFLDADMFVLKNIDWLFNYPNGAALYSKTEKMGMSGLFVFNPYYHSYEIYKIILDNYSDLDGGIIGNLFFSAKENPDFQISEKIISDNLLLNDNAFIFHSYKLKIFKSKPEELKANLHFPLYRKYCEIFLPLKIKYK